MSTKKTLGRPHTRKGVLTVRVQVSIGPDGAIDALTLPWESLTVPPHGLFEYQSAVYAIWKRMPRTTLVREVLDIYKDRDSFGSRAAHWRGYKKAKLAAIVAHHHRLKDERGRPYGAPVTGPATEGST